MVKNALSRHFDCYSNQCSPIQKDVVRIVQYDQDGTEFISYKEVDYPSLMSSNGFVQDWSLNKLLAAGINPDFAIRTGFNNRLEGIDSLQEYARVAEEIIAESSKTE